MQLDQLADRVDLVVGEAQRLHPLAGDLGADHVVVVEGDRAVVEEPAGPRLADVVHQRREAGTRSRGRRPEPVLEVDRLLEHGQGVLVDVLVPVVLVALERAAPAARAAPARPARSRPAALRPGRGYGAQISLTSSSRTRSAEMISIRSAIVGHRRDHLGRDVEAELGGEPGRAHHPQRVVGERVLRRARGAQHAGGEVDQRRRTGPRTRGRAAATAIALTVKSRRPRSPVEACRRSRPSGLRRRRVVGLGAVGRHLDGPRRPCGSRWCRSRGPCPRSRRAHAAEQPLGVVGPRRGREVEVVAAAGRASRRAPGRRPGPARGRPRRTRAPSSSTTGRDPLQLGVRLALQLDHGSGRQLGSDTRVNSRARGGPRAPVARPDVRRAPVGAPARPASVRAWPDRAAAGPRLRSRPLVGRVVAGRR